MGLYSEPHAKVYDHNLGTSPRRPVPHAGQPLGGFHTYSPARTNDRVYLYVDGGRCSPRLLRGRINHVLHRQRAATARRPRVHGHDAIHSRQGVSAVAVRPPGCRLAVRLGRIGRMTGSTPRLPCTCCSTPTTLYWWPWSTRPFAEVNGERTGSSSFGYSALPLVPRDGARVVRGRCDRRVGTQRGRD